MKVGMTKCFHRLKKEVPEVSLILQVHDELLFEGPPEALVEAKRVVQKTLEDQELLKDFGIPHLDVVMKVESAQGLSWGDL
jgi:DNA polymerase-1